MQNKKCILYAKDKKVEYTLVKTNRKTIGITVYANGEVRVSAPYRASEKQIKEIIESKADWIIKKVNKIHSIKSTSIYRHFVDGEKLLYLGNEYQLIIESKNCSKAEVVLNEDVMSIWVCIPNEVPLEERQKFIKELLIKWYSQRFCEIVKNKIQKFSKQIGVKVNRIAIKNQKTRWGSCSKKGNINLNWRLVMSPCNIIDYVIVHELCHLKVMNHSKEFWDVVKSVIPDYTERRKWLKANGSTLEIL